MLFTGKREAFGIAEKTSLNRNKKKKSEGINVSNIQYNFLTIYTEKGTDFIMIDYKPS